MRLVEIALLIGLVGPARADEVDDLVAHGEALAKRGEFTSAIAAFKQADAERPRASHACLIGLVYTRRELWPQAELFLARCHARATPDDPLPRWLETVERQLLERLEAAGAAPVTIVVKPATAVAKITVSSFAPDEVFEPHTIHLAPGRHQLDVTAVGYVATSRDVVVETAEPQTITIELQTPAEAAPRPIKAPSAPAPGRRVRCDRQQQCKDDLQLRRRRPLRQAVRVDDGHVRRAGGGRRALQHRSHHGAAVPVARDLRRPDGLDRGDLHAPRSRRVLLSRVTGAPSK